MCKVSPRLRELVAKEDETRRKLSQDMSVEELYNVIAEEIDSIYANG